MRQGEERAAAGLAPALSPRRGAGREEGQRRPDERKMVCGAALPSDCQDLIHSHVCKPPGKGDTCHRPLPGMRFLKPLNDVWGGLVSLWGCQPPSSRCPAASRTQPVCREFSASPAARTVS